MDLRFTNPKFQEVERYDPVLRLPIEIRTAKSWADSWDLSDSRLSPLLADLTILGKRHVKIHCVTGGYDILTPDTLLPFERNVRQLRYVENGWSGISRCTASQLLSRIVYRKVCKGMIGSLMC